MFSSGSIGDAELQQPGYYWEPGHSLRAQHAIELGGRSRDFRALCLDLKRRHQKQRQSCMGQLFDTCCTSLGRLDDMHIRARVSNLCVDEQRPCVLLATGGDFLSLKLVGHAHATELGVHLNEIYIFGACSGHQYGVILGLWLLWITLAICLITSLQESHFLSQRPQLVNSRVVCSIKW